MKKIIFLIFLQSSLIANSQYKLSDLKIGVGTSFFNINENFDNLFIFNNSSPIIVGIKNKKIRLESITNISLATENNEQTFVRGSVRLNLDYIKDVSEKMKIYFGPQYGLNTNRTHLINFHLGGEYFLHENWSISNQVGLNFLFDDENQSFVQTNSSIILRFYFKLKKE